MYHLLIADALFGFYMVSIGVALISDPDQEPTLHIVSNPEEWRLAGYSSMGIAFVMYGISRLTLRETPAKRTGIALLVVGACILSLVVGGLLIFNLD